MRVYEMIVDERRRAADLLSGLSAAQWGQQTLCADWTVHEVAAHLISYLRFGQAKLYVGILGTAGDIDRINLRLTRREARRGSGEIVEVLRRRARSRVSIPRSGYDPVLTDIVLHDLDIRRPLGIERAIVEERLRVAFHHLVAKPAPGYNMGSRLAALRLVATDTGWTHGTGAPVRGPAEALVLAISGRDAGFDELDGEGAAILRQRVTGRRRAPVRRRMAAVAGVLVNPPPRERRSRRAVAPALEA